MKNSPSSIAEDPGNSRGRRLAEEYIRAAVSTVGESAATRNPDVLEKTLFTIDELTGLVVTTALIRPSKSVLDVALKSVKNKWKDKRFAAASTVDHRKGAAMLGVPWRK